MSYTKVLLYNLYDLSELACILAFGIAIIITLISILKTEISKTDETTTFYVPKQIKIAFWLFAYAILWFIFLRNVM